MSVLVLPVIVDAPRSFAMGTRSQPIEISSEESNNESESDSPTNFSHEQQHNRIPRSKLAIRETLIRQQLVTASSTSSAGSSSTTTSSILDTSIKDAAVIPLTPPLPDSTSAKITNVRSHDTTHQIISQNKTSKVGGSFVADPPSQPRPSTPDVPEDDRDIDELSSNIENLSLESPAAQRYDRMKRDERLQEEVDDSLDESSELPVREEKSGQNTKTPCRNCRDGCRRTDQVPSSSPAGTLSRDAVKHERNSLSHNKKITYQALAIESENDLSAEEDSNVSINSLPIPIRRLSPPKSTHKRSKSAPKIQYTLEAKDIDASQSIAQANKRSDIDPLLVPTSAPKSRKRGSSSLSAATRQSRSRSAGSIPEVPQTFTREKKEIIPAIPIVESARASSTNKLESTTKRQSISVSEKGRLERCPQFTRYEKKKPQLSRNDIKKAILAAVRCEKAEKRHQTCKVWNWIWNDRSKSKQVSYAEGGYVYMFKVDEFEHSAPGHLKIGQTKQEVSKRLKQWDNKCDIKARHISDDKDKRFRHYDIVEKIVHAELCDARREYKCWCGVAHDLDVVKGVREKNGHTEWFKIDENPAVEVVEKWRDWVIRMQPYHNDGSLRACWIWKYDQAMNADVVDWVAFREFSYLEVCRCCFHHFWELLKNSWPRRGRLEWLTLEFLFLLITGFISFYNGGASISSFRIWVAFLGLYIFGWFNFG